MMGVLIAGIAGLALLDSLNPGTIVAITLILLTGPRRPILSAMAFVIGAALTVFTLGAVVFISAGAAADVVSDGIVWLRRLAFGLAAVALFVAAARRLRPRARQAIRLPAWFSPATALPLGVVMTGADLPNAFPYFIAIERLISAEADTTTGLVVLAGYAVIYCLPCLVLLLAGRVLHDHVQPWLQRLFRRLTTGTSPRSVPAAIALSVLGIGVASIAATA
jgi:cytochrome c biogenesis protein CcdA